jgi:hypothetical protein
MKSTKVSDKRQGSLSREFERRTESQLMGMKRRKILPIQSVSIANSIQMQSMKVSGNE